MIFNYGGKTFDTADQSSLALSNTKNLLMQRAFVNQWFFDENWIEKQLRVNKLQTLFDLALSQARYADLVKALTGNDIVTDSLIYPTNVLAHIKNNSKLVE